jgi:hypothetical protein
MESFETAVTNFKAFLVQQGYPPNLLWLTPDDIVFGGLRYFFWKGDASERTSHAKSGYESGLAANVGIAFEARCKTERWAICRVYIPNDDLDAQYRMIPKTGVKFSATVDPRPATEIESRIQWRLLKWWMRKARSCWD